MIARQTNSQSFKIRINFVSKIFWFKVHVFFADKTIYNMFQRLPVGGEGGGGAVPYLVFVNLVGAPFCCQCIMHMFFFIQLL